MLTEQQRAFRRQGLTATDVPAILGFDPNRSAWQVQQEKRGVDTFKGNLFTRAGEALEPVIAGQYAEDNDGVILRQGVTAQHPEFPLLLATPDYVVLDAVTQAPRRLLECKSVFSWLAARDEWGPPETDLIPSKFYVQVQWQLGVLRVDEADVARFHAGEVRYWRVRFDAATFSDLRGLADSWWHKHIVRGIDCVPQAIDLEAVRRGSRPQADPPIAEAATPAEEALLVRWRELYKQQKEIEAQADAIEAQVIEAIGVRSSIKGEKSDIKVSYNEAKSPKTTDWLGLARKLGATPDDVMDFTSRGASYRRMWCSFWNEKNNKKAKGAK